MIELEKKTLRECLSLIIDNRGKTPPKIESGLGYKILSANHVKFDGLVKTDSIEYGSDETYSKWMTEELKRGDILLTSEAPAGQAMLWDSDEKVIVAQRLFALRTNPKVADNKFIKYYLQSDLGQKEITRNTSGSTVFGISARMLDQIIVHLPECTSMQSDIGNFLYSLDKKIALNNRINTELEAMAKTLYDYWFVQFDFPDANGKPYKTSGGKIVYNPTLKREIPEGWEATTVGKISKTELGGTPSTSVDEYWQNADIPWLSSAETASFPIITSEQKVTQAGIDNSAATLLPKGTVVISIVRYIRPSILGIDAATNQSVVGIRECKRLKSSFIYPYFSSEVPRLMALRTGAQQPHINKGVIEDSPIVIPCEKILTNYYKTADPIFEKIMNLALQNHELMLLRDWLLPMLMNGQVIVK